jgi:transglutaminase-like putative cysteine protease
MAFSGANFRSIPTTPPTAKSKRQNQAAAGDVYNIPRHSFLWLLIAVVAVILPHVLRMPFWLTSICALCLAGRVLIYQGRLSFPGRKLKTALVLIMVVMVVSQFGRQIFSTDATVGVLLTGITLKLLEMQRKRDVLLVLYLCYFTVISEFIYSQSIPIAFYMVLVVVLITAALMSLNQTQEGQSPWRTFRFSALVLLQSIPLMLAFFILFPRIQPLWSVPIQSGNSKTGLSENMAPGDIGELARSAAVAFRVKFETEAPPYNQLYWRALTLDEFNGRRWSRGFNMEPQFLGPQPDTVRPWFQAIEYLGEPVRYNVILEPTNQNWLFALQMPRIVDDRMLMRTDYQIDTIRRVTQRYTYNVRSHLSWRAETGTESREQRRARIIPRQSNTRAIEFAQNLREQTGSDASYIAAVLEHFRTEEFFYTLSPATLGDNPVDEFLFNTREGFCEHFASAFTFLMRAAGIPARVVTGYMGGEFNPYDGTLTVRQYDAHAWSEVWLPELGWVRYDPTAAVAPNRVDQGSDVALQEQEDFMGDEVFSLIQYRNSLLLNQLRYRLEMIDYAWNRFVLNYDQDMQSRFFNQLFGSLTRTIVLLVVLGVMVLVTGLIVFAVFRISPTEPKAPATRLYLKFCATLAKLGFARLPGETPEQYMRRISELNPQWKLDIEEITLIYVYLAYVSNEQHPEQLQALKRRVRNFKLLA